MDCPHEPPRIQNSVATLPAQLRRDMITCTGGARDLRRPLKSPDADSARFLAALLRWKILPLRRGKFL